MTYNGNSYQISWLLRYFIPRSYSHLARMVGVILLTLAAIALSVATPFIFGELVATLQSRGEGYLAAVLLAGGVWTCARLFAELKEIISYRLMLSGIENLSLSVFEHLLRLPLEYHMSRPAGATLDDMKRTQLSLIRALIGFFMFIIPSAFEALVAVAAMTWWYSWQVGAIFTIFFGAFFVIALYGSREVLLAEHHANKAESATAGFVFDRLNNLQVVHTYSGGSTERRRARVLLDRVEQARSKSLWANSKLQFFQITTMGLGLLMASSYVLYLGAGGERVRDFVTFNTYVIQFSGAFGVLNRFLKTIREQLADIQPLHSLLLEPEEQTDHEHQVALLSKRAYPISVRGLSFAYVADTTVLKNVSLEIPAKSFVAFVGSSGSGKSTLAHLIARLHLPQSGKILFGDHESQTIAPASFRAQIGFVPQQPRLFHTTIFANIAYGASQACESGEVINVAKIAGIDKKIAALPYGYQTEVGLDGGRLSGGERQRVALARALIRKPHTLILDEATSALDPQGELELYHNINHAFPDMTRIVIAHRLSTIRAADTIFVIDKGALVEKGTHDELIEKNGRYALLWERERERIAQI